jgi:hypothetical protein
MKIEHWLTIVLIIATFIAQLTAPVLAEFVRSRISQPRPTPQPHQPKTLIRRMGDWIFSFLTSPPQRFKRLQMVGLASPLVAMLFPIYLLRAYLLNPIPPTRLVVALMSMSVTLLWFSFLNFLFNVSIHLIWLSIRDATKSSTKQSERLSQLANIVARLHERVDALTDNQSAISKTLELTQLAQSEIEKPPTPGTLRKIITAIKNLLKQPN